MTRGEGGRGAQHGRASSKSFHQFLFQILDGVLQLSQLPIPVCQAHSGKFFPGLQARARMGWSAAIAHWRYERLMFRAVLGELARATRQGKETVLCTASGVPRHCESLYTRQVDKGKEVGCRSKQHSKNFSFFPFFHFTNYFLEEG